MPKRVIVESNSGKRRLWIMVTTVVVSIAPIVFTVRTVDKQRFDGVRINLAGRQRMLTQKLSKEILLFAQGRVPAERVRRTMRAFETTLFALLRGGPAPVDLDFRAQRKLPPMEDAAIRKQLQHVVTLWTVFARRLQDYLATRSEPALEHVISSNGALLAEMDRSVTMMQGRSERNSSVVSGVLLGTGMAALALLGFLLLRKGSQLRTASAHIKRLEIMLPICASCKSIRTDDAHDSSPSAWQSIEQYLHEEESIDFTHSICPDCREKLYPSESSHAH